MAKYAIRYEEVLARTFIVEAETPEKAVEKVNDNIDKIALDYNDYTDCETKVSPYANDDGTATKWQLEVCEDFSKYLKED